MLYGSGKHPAVPGQNVPGLLRDHLESNGILVTWASCNAQSKSSWDITADNVSLSTIHSMKGMDAKVVFVWGLDSLGSGNLPLNRQRTLAYVACSRARQHLYIIYCDKTPLIHELYEVLSS